jgi:hypothetical protein
MKNHPVDILFQTESNGFDNLFHELFSSKHAPVSIFKKDRDLSRFEKYVKDFFDNKLIIPFTGEVQIASLQYLNTENFESLKFEDGVETIYIENANSISEILVGSLQNEDDLCWVDNFKYLGNGKLLILINEHENDFIRFNEPFFNALIDDSYILDTFTNDQIEFHKNSNIFKLETFCYEPLMITLNYFNEALKPLIEKEVRDEILKFLPGLSNWNAIPAVFNKTHFSLIANFDWGWISEQTKKGDNYNGDYLSTKALKFLSTQRKNIKYDLNNNINPFEQLVKEINTAEQYIFGETYHIDLEFRNGDDIFIKPNGFEGFNFQEIKILENQTRNNLGSIYLWKYILTESLITIEYSLHKTSKELILYIPFVSK